LAGLAIGDVITAIDGRLVTKAQDIQALTLERRPGETVVVERTRDGVPGSVSLTLGRQG
jgi:S1-C subfamily serine protease